MKGEASSLLRGAPGGAVAARLEGPFHLLAAHLSGELALAAGEAEADLVTAQHDVLEWHFLAVDRRAAGHAGELLAQRERRGRAADRWRHAHRPVASDLRRHDVEVDECRGHAADLHLVF